MAWHTSIAMIKISSIYNTKQYVTIHKTLSIVMHQARVIPRD